MTNGQLNELKDLVLALTATTAGIDSRLGGLDDRVTAIDSRLGGLDDRVTAIDSRLGGLDDRVTAIDSRLTRVDENVAAIGTRLTEEAARLDRRIDEQTRVLQSMSSHLTSRLINFEGRVEERFNTIDERFGALNEQLRTVETGLLNEIRLQAMRTTRVEERLSGLEGAA